MKTESIRRRLRGLVSLWLAVLLLVPAAFTVPAAADGLTAGSWDELELLAESSAKGVYDFGGKSIEITGTVTIDSMYLGSTTLKNAYFTCGSDSVGCMFEYIGANQKSDYLELRFENIVIDGGRSAATPVSHDGPAILCGVRAENGDKRLNTVMANTTLKNWENRSAVRYGTVMLSTYGDNSTAVLTMTDSTIADCEGLCVGGVWLAGNSTFNMTDSIISGCNAGIGGGVYCMNNGTFNMTDSIISGCNAVVGGGVYCMDDGIFSMTDSSVTGCTASDQGGGVYLCKTSGYNGKIELSGRVVISGNRANNAVSNLLLNEAMGRTALVAVDADVPLTAGSRIGVEKAFFLDDDFLNVSEPCVVDCSRYFYADRAAERKILSSDGNVVVLAKSATTETWVEFCMQGHGRDKRVNVGYNEAVSPADIPETKVSGYKFTGWYTEPGCTTEWDPAAAVTEPIAVYAGWSAVSNATYYTVTATAGEGGSISPREFVSVLKGRNKTFSVVPDEGYVIADVTVDGESVKDRLVDGTYTFENVQKSHTLAAEFEKKGDPFSDVKQNDWFYDDVGYVYEKKLMEGTGDREFSPCADTTRGMIVTVLYRLEGEPAVAGTSTFADVPAGKYYGNAISWAEANGIVNGYGYGKFGPEDPITREQLATILYRYAEYKGCDVTAQADMSGFTDIGAVSDYAVRALAWANAEGLVKGMENSRLAPKETATRAQTAATLHRYCENIVK